MDYTVNKKIFIRLTWHLLWIAMLLEGVTVPSLLLLNAQGFLGHFKSPLQGFVIGSLGALILWKVFNYFFVPHLAIEKEEKITHASGAFLSCVYGGVFLALIFIFQNILTTILGISENLSVILLKGLLSAGMAIGFTLTLYENISYFFPALVIKIYTKTHKYSLISFSKTMIVFLIATYEAIALPIIFQAYQHTQNSIFYGFFYGSLGGLAGALAMLLTTKIFYSIGYHLWIKISRQ